MQKLLAKYISALFKFVNLPTNIIKIISIIEVNKFLNVFFIIITPHNKVYKQVLVVFFKLMFNFNVFVYLFTVEILSNFAPIHILVR